MCKEIAPYGLHLDGGVHDSCCRRNLSLFWFLLELLAALQAQKEWMPSLLQLCQNLHIATLMLVDSPVFSSMIIDRIWRSPRIGWEPVPFLFGLQICEQDAREATSTIDVPNQIWNQFSFPGTLQSESSAAQEHCFMSSNSPNSRNSSWWWDPYLQVWM